MASMSSRQLDLLVQDLCQYEADIHQLIWTSSEYSPPPAELNLKMMQMMDAAIRIPREESDLNDEWNGRMNMLRAQISRRWPRKPKTPQRNGPQQAQQQKKNNYSNRFQSTRPVEAASPRPSTSFAVTPPPPKTAPPPTQPPAPINDSGFDAAAWDLAISLDVELTTIEDTIKQLFDLKPVPVAEVERQLAELWKKIELIPALFDDMGANWIVRYDQFQEQLNRIRPPLLVDTTTTTDSHFNNKPNQVGSYGSSFIAPKTPLLPEPLSQLPINKPTAATTTTTTSTMKFDGQPILSSARSPQHVLPEFKDLSITTPTVANIQPSNKSNWTCPPLAIPAEPKATLPQSKQLFKPEETAIANKPVVDDQPKGSSQADSCTKQPNSAQSIENGLQNLESTIMKMLNTPKPSVQELDDKVIELMDMITSLPQDCVELISKWQDRVSILMEKRAQIVTEEEEAVAESSFNTSTTTKVEQPNNEFSELLISFDPIESQPVTLKPTDLSANASAWSPLEDDLESVFGSPAPVLTPPLVQQQPESKEVGKCPVQVDDVSLKAAIHPPISQHGDSNQNNTTPLGDTLESDLLHLEAAINYLLPSASQNSAELEMLLSSLLDKIDGAPPVLFSKWKTKVSELWDKYSSSKSEKELELNSSPESVVTVRAKTPPLVEQKREEPVHTATNTNITEDIKNRIKSALDRTARVKSDHDVSGQRQLLLICAKARKLLQHHQFGAELYSAAYQLARDKLHTSCVQKLASSTSSTTDDGKAALDLLITTVQQQLLDSAKKTQKKTPNEFDSMFKCANCKGHGHLVHLCPEVKDLLCLSCFTFGHRLVRCPTGELPVDQLVL